MFVEVENERARRKPSNVVFTCERRRRKSGGAQG